MNDYLNQILQLATGHGFAVLPVYGLNEMSACSCP